MPKFIASVVLCELVGILGTPFTIAAIPTWYATLTKPSFSPPSWLFGPVWTLLYFLMGISFYLIWKQEGKKSGKGKSITRKDTVRNAEVWFFAQLALNFLWSLLFFGLRSPVLGLIDIVVMWGLILITMHKFYPLSKTAAYLLIPYLLWVSFASLLNFAIVVLN